MNFYERRVRRERVAVVWWKIDGYSNNPSCYSFIQNTELICISASSSYRLGSVLQAAIATPLPAATDVSVEPPEAAEPQPQQH